MIIAFKPAYHNLRGVMHVLSKVVTGKQDSLLKFKRFTYSAIAAVIITNPNPNTSTNTN